MQELKRKDATGRDYFWDDEFDETIPVKPKHLPLLEALNRHGMAIRPWLFEYSPDYTNEDSLLPVLQKLRKGGYIFRPAFQRQTENPDAHFHVYQITPRGQQALDIHGRLEDTIKPSGNDQLHQYGIAASTFSIELGARAAGVEYIPGHRILAKNNTTLRCEELRLTPDQFFGLKFGDTWRVHPLEFERSYIDVRSWSYSPRVQNKKSDTYADKVKRYTRYISDGIYRDHLGIDAGMVALFVFNAEGAERKFHEAIAKQHSKCSFIATQVVDGFLPVFVPQLAYTQLYTGPWKRHGYPDFYINQA